MILKVGKIEQHMVEEKECSKDGEEEKKEGNQITGRVQWLSRGCFCKGAVFK